MKGYKEKTFGDRISAAATARQAALERFRARPAADDPAVLRRRLECKLRLRFIPWKGKRTQLW